MYDCQRDTLKDSVKDSIDFKKPGHFERKINKKKELTAMKCC